MNANIGDFVYVYLFDLKSYLKAYKKLNERRFGRIIEKNEVNINKNNVSNEYVVELLDGSQIVIKDYLYGFEFMNMFELQNFVLGLSELSDEEKDVVMSYIQDIMKKMQDRD